MAKPKQSRPKKTKKVVEADGVIPLLSIPRLLALVSGTEAVLDLALVDHLWPRMPDDPGADTSWSPRTIS